MKRVMQLSLTSRWRGALPPPIAYDPKGFYDFTLVTLALIQPIGGRSQTMWTNYDSFWTPPVVRVGQLSVNILQPPSPAPPL